MENQQDLKPQISPLTFSTVVIEKYMCFFVFSLIIGMEQMVKAVFNEICPFN